ncbi:hypothetical protein ACFDR9_002070 [Janthinobacterium sp. CG_23.3]|uniref:DUF5681 domain-containing protein n=1 Tax=Janthinobacterium sp. CG_23.3 TaxID=3349634 RepID=UPI0038D3AF52
MTEPKKKPGRWKAGESGNPRGKTPGSGELQRLRAAIGEHVPEIITQLVAAARGGDIQAARLILERVLPPVKAIEQAQAIDLPEHGTLTDQGRAVLSAVAAGELAPGQGAQLLAAIGTLGKIAELDELAARITALEGKHAKH